jgi:tetraacyldisaccharide 4'-kinase
MRRWPSFQAFLEQRLPGIWSQKGLGALLLWPVGQLYRLLSALDRQRQHRVAQAQPALGLPVWVVGNAYVGGTGKTPITIALVQWLQAQGLQPGVVSRGQGRHSDTLLAVSLDTPAQRVGDEPWLIHQKTGVPVYVGADRRLCASALRNAHPEVNIVVSDDGLQHHRLASDLRICVWDDRGLGNGWLLPAGPLRQAWPVQADVHLLSINPLQKRWHPSVQEALLPICHRVERRLSDHALNAAGLRRPVRSFVGTTVCAVAGIARPEVFFDMLREKGVQLAVAHAPGDHNDLLELPPRLRQGLLLCTEKDAPKLWQQGIEAWSVALDVHMPEALWPVLQHRLRASQSPDKRLSSPNGHKTA